MRFYSYKIVIIVIIYRGIELPHFGSVDLFVFRGNQHSSDANQLELLSGNSFVLEEAIDDVDGEEDGFGKQLEFDAYFGQPINEDHSVDLGYVHLLVHVSRAHFILDLYYIH